MYNPPLNDSKEIQEIQLWNTTSEREKYESLADLYAIMVTTEHLEKQYIRDSISPSEYTPTCTKLIAQFKTALNLVHDYVPDIQKFIKDYR
ncbi:Vacuolar protein-sorting-associated protein 28, partial [Coelomomyces lativittatus]